MTDALLTYSLRDRTALVTLNSPQTRNSLSREMAAELSGLVDRAQEEARVLLLTGAGTAFSSGGNLAEGGFDIDDPARDIGMGLEKFHNPLLRKLRDLAIPVVTAVNGPAIGVGASLAMIGDIVCATPDAYFRFSFQGVGLAPDGGATWLLSRSVGRHRALELVLTGRKYMAQEAERDGLVARVVEQDKLRDAAIELCSNLTKMAPLSVSLARRAVWNALDQDFDAQLDEDRRNQKLAGASDDFVEGVSAFREKRRPEFGAPKSGG